MTTSSRRALALGAAVAALVSVGGCGGGADTGSPASRDTPLPTSSSSAATPSAASPSAPSSPPSSGAASPSSSAPAPSASAPALPVPGGGPVRITAPQEGEHLAAGPVRVTGTGTAPEGTLLWRITDAAGAVVADGHTSAGANGATGPFTVEQGVQAGTCAPCTVRVWVPDDSDGEGAGGAAAATRTFTVG